jgi:hypothetical protein
MTRQNAALSRSPLWYIRIHLLRNLLHARNDSGACLYQYPNCIGPRSNSGFFHFSLEVVEEQLRNCRLPPTGRRPG